VNGNSTISNNSAYYYGGGIENEGTASIVGATLTGNTGTKGGAIFNGADAALPNGAHLLVSSSNISGNTASVAGGGIFNDVFQYYNATLTGIVTVNNSSTISGNTAPVGADVDNLGVLYQDASSIVAFLAGNAAIPI
jgi:hypothetical protein